MDLDEIWHRGGAWEGEGSWMGFDPVPPTLGYRVCNRGMGVSGPSAVHFGKNLLKQKLQGTPI